jgi:transcriptional regulator with XRE-family HTH domain
MSLQENLGSVIVQYRAQLGMSQEALATKAGLHRTYLSDVERGLRNLTLDVIERIAGALDVSLSEMFRRAANPNATDKTNPLNLQDLLSELQQQLDVMAEQLGRQQQSKKDRRKVKVADEAGDLPRRRSIKLVGKQQKRKRNR